MKKFALIALAAAAFLQTGCRESDQRIPRADSPDARPEATDSSTRSSFEAEKERAEKALSEQLAGVDKRMEELKQRANSASEKAKAEWEEQRPKLEAQRAEAQKKLEELRATSKEKWNEVKPKAEAAFEELEQGFKNAWSKLKE